MADSRLEYPIRGEEEAWRQLAALVAGRSPMLTPGQSLISERWAHFSLTLDGPKFSGTITPPVMETLLTLQAAINRSMALSSRGIENARLLTDVEKNRIEIQAKVTEGTTTVDVDGTAIINHFIDVAGGAMTGEQITIIAVAAALLYFGASAYRAFLRSRAETRAKEIDSQDKAALVTQIGALSEQETERAKIMAAALTKEPKLLGRVIN